MYFDEWYAEPGHDTEYADRVQARCDEKTAGLSPGQLADTDLTDRLQSEAESEIKAEIDAGRPTGYGVMRYPDNAENGKAGQIIQFTTLHAGDITDEDGDGVDDEDKTKRVGCANVELNSNVDKVVIEANRYYYLREVVPPTPDYALADFWYSCMITDDLSKADYSKYVFLPDDILTAKNHPTSGGILVYKTFDGTGAEALTESDRTSGTILEFNITQDELDLGLSKEIYLTNTYNQPTVDLAATKYWKTAAGNPMG